MTTFRPYRNGDSPALTALWNRGVPASAPAVARPLVVPEFDGHVVGNPCFEAAGLIVAEREGRIVGFAHAGFGPGSSAARPLALSHALGTVAMFVVDPAVDDPGLEDTLFRAAEEYLRARGAAVLYAGGQTPLNPFYWGIYGGSECAGIPGAHAGFHRAAGRAGYQPVSETVLLEFDLAEPETRDPRGVLVRRQARTEVTDDALPAWWWQTLAVGEFRPTLYRLLARPGEAELARATTWDMAWFGRTDGRSRVGLIDVEVQSDHRRKGYGRFLVTEILRLAREQMTAVVSVQTAATNLAALRLYEAIGFQPVETATLYRRPGGAP